mmetsp:Transcript_63550/g.127641  ORF Transcript_63550/g.127641 Transcript_63550/m.127641 type:complete len:239 (-) Transcript_63550:828-1544(-)
MKQLNKYNIKSLTVPVDGKRLEIWLLVINVPNHLQRHQRNFCPCNIFQVSENVDTPFAACATNCNIRTIRLTKVYLVDGSWSVVEVDAILGDKLKLTSLVSTLFHPKYSNLFRCGPKKPEAVPLSMVHFNFRSCEPVDKQQVVQLCRVNRGLDLPEGWISGYKIVLEINTEANINERHKHEHFLHIGNEVRHLPTRIFHNEEPSCSSSKLKRHGAMAVGVVEKRPAHVVGWHLINVIE